MTCKLVHLLFSPIVLPSFKKRYAAVTNNTIQIQVVQGMQQKYVHVQHMSMHNNLLHSIFGFHGYSYLEVSTLASSMEIH